MPLQLYVHIPFCVSKCRYCDFISAAPREGEMAAYCRALESEIALHAPAYRDYIVDTVFIGGGTPSVLPDELMDGVLKALRRSFNIDKGAEFTVEVNPGTLTGGFMETITAHGANRVSLGMQARQERLLRALGRAHSFSDVEAAVNIIRGAGVSNMNIDVMNSLPAQTQREYIESLQAACELGATHISAYSLIVEEGTPLFDSVAVGETLLPSEDEACDIEEVGRAYLISKGYRRYEISNYSREGFECRHNIGYWQGKYYLGMGLAAHSMLPPEGEGCYDRASNVTRLGEYIDRLSAGVSPVAQRRAIHKEEAMFESVMLGLRTVNGVDMLNFKRRFDITPVEAYGERIKPLISDGLIEISGGRMALTPRGMSVQNAVLLRFMPDSDSGNRL